MKSPWHLWIVGILALLWNAGGAFDYYMTQTGNEEYLSALSVEQRLFLDTLPVWFHASWAFAVWGAVAGSLLILFRSRFAVSMFSVSLLGMIVTSIYSIFIASPNAIEISGQTGALFSLAILFSILFLITYCRIMKERGHLR